MWLITPSAFKLNLHNRDTNAFLIPLSETEQSVFSKRVNENACCSESQMYYYSRKLWLECETLICLAFHTFSIPSLGDGEKLIGTK
jgi:hypothetical protein